MKFRYIDAIRGIAILLVIMVHTSQDQNLENTNWIVSSFLEKGAKGVQMFFLASAFTLFLSYNNRKIFEENVTISFYVRRIFRIAPMYFIGIMYFNWENSLDNNNIYTFGEVISNIFFIHGISPYWINNLVPGGWSITVEMTFYLILPILIKKITNLNRAVIFTLGSYFFAMFVRLIFQKFQLISNKQLWEEFSYYNFFNQLPVFGLGIILYFLIIKKEVKTATYNIALISLIFISHNIWGLFLPNYILFSFGFLLLIYALSQKEYVLFVNKMTVFLGKISYSAYLVHFAVLYWIDTFGLNDLINLYNPNMKILSFVIRFITVLIITSTISLGFYYAIEIPFQKLGKRFIKRINRKITAYKIYPQIR